MENISILTALLFFVGALLMVSSPTLATETAATEDGVHHEQGNGHEDCTLTCDDDWWNCQMNSWSECDYEKVLEKWPAPMQRTCVENLVGDGQEIINCLEEQQCFTDGQDWCDSWQCDFYQCDRWSICYGEQEGICNGKRDKCGETCEQEYPNEEPDCVEVVCYESLEACINDVGCMNVVTQVSEHQQCEPEHNGGQSCFDEQYQKDLCNEFGGTTTATDSESDSGSCFKNFNALAVCYESNCYEEEHDREHEHHADTYDEGGYANNYYNDEQYYFEPHDYYYNDWDESSNYNYNNYDNFNDYNNYDRYDDYHYSSDAQSYDYNNYDQYNTYDSYSSYYPSDGADADPAYYNNYDGDYYSSSDYYYPPQRKLLRKQRAASVRRPNMRLRRGRRAHRSAGKQQEQRGRKSRRQLLGGAQRQRLRQQHRPHPRHQQSPRQMRRRPAVAHRRQREQHQQRTRPRLQKQQRMGKRSFATAGTAAKSGKQHQQQRTPRKQKQKQKTMSLKTKDKQTFRLEKKSVNKKE